MITTDDNGNQYVYGPEHFDSGREPDKIERKQTVTETEQPGFSVYKDSIPDEDIAICLKVLRTIRNECLGPNFFDADGAVILSHAHAKIVDLVERANDGE